MHVDSVDEVDVAMTDLLRDKKVANATHNIAAYRIVEPDGRLVRPPPHAAHRIPNLRVLTRSSAFVPPGCVPR